MQGVIPESTRPLPRPVANRAKEVDAGHVPSIDEEIHTAGIAVFHFREIVTRVQSVTIGMMLFWRLRSTKPFMPDSNCLKIASFSLGVALFLMPSLPSDRPADHGGRRDG
jgi:hypothetical protein